MADGIGQPHAIITKKEVTWARSYPNKKPEPRVNPPPFKSRATSLGRTVDKPKLGRPRVIAGGVRVAVFLSAEQAAWLKAQPQGNSETVRQLIEKARESETVFLAKELQDKETQEP